MSLYTPMPLELVFDGWSKGPGVSFVDLTIDGVTMRVIPVSPGVGRIERLLNAPLDYYLKPEFQPGQMIFYAGEASSTAGASAALAPSESAHGEAGMPVNPFPV